MKEQTIIRKTFETMRNQGGAAAYAYIAEEIGTVEAEERAALYPYCVSLATLCGRTAEALAILQFAVKTEGFWYLPEVFENSELDDIRDEKAFIACQELSRTQYEQARRTAKTVCTWEEKTAERIVLALHGDGENRRHAKQAWHFFRQPDQQMECLQSREPDRYGLYCWEADTDSWTQIPETCRQIRWDEYRERTLCGYGAACDAILRAVARGTTDCERIVLYAPWAPLLVTDEAETLLQRLKERNTKLYLLCGTEDDTCYPQAQRLAEALRKAGVFVQMDWIEGQSHDFPADLEQRVTALLTA